MVVKVFFLLYVIALQDRLGLLDSQVQWELLVLPEQLGLLELPDPDVLIQYR
jgi:hypothetical protein